MGFDPGTGRIWLRRAMIALVAAGIGAKASAATQWLGSPPYGITISTHISHRGQAVEGSILLPFEHDAPCAITVSTSGAGGEVNAKKGPAYSRSERYRWDFDRAMDIFRAETDGSNLVRLTDTPGYDAEGSYSPDGKQIIFTSFRDGDAEIYIMDADGKNPRRITRKPGYDGGPFFSPDGARIVYRSDRKQNDLLQVFLNTPDGSAERPLTDNNAVNWGPYFFRDSRHIVYSTSLHGHQNYEIYWMDTRTGKQERITYREGFDALPVFSNDGRKLMWTSKGRTADNTSQLFIADFTEAMVDDSH